MVVKYIPETKLIEAVKIINDSDVVEMTLDDQIPIKDLYRVFKKVMELLDDEGLLGDLVDSSPLNLYQSIARNVVLRGLENPFAEKQEDMPKSGMGLKTEEPNTAQYFVAKFVLTQRKQGNLPDRKETIKETRKQFPTVTSQYIRDQYKTGILWADIYERIYGK